MKDKNTRQKKIQQLIAAQAIETQVELAEELQRAGFSVTQATVSRDIKEMGLIKVPAGANTSKYSLPDRISPTHTLERARRIFRENVASFDSSENIVLIRTVPGAAMVGASAIDGLGWTEVLGSVAGDDTILVVVKPKEAVPDLMRKLGELLR